MLKCKRKSSEKANVSMYENENREITQQICLQADPWNTGCTGIGGIYYDPDLVERRKRNPW